MSAIFPSSHQQKIRYSFVLQLVLCLVLVSIPGHAVIADRYDERRAHVGMKLFKMMLLADTDRHKKRDDDGALGIALLYITHSSAVRRLEKTADEQLASITNPEVHIRSVSLEDLLAGDTPPTAGIFITQKLDGDELKALIEFSIEHQVVLFSPFEGDVEAGVLGGISVEARVRPALNMDTLMRAQINIKPFFVKVAKQYAVAE
ncbi:hypothetical protein ACFOEK_20820 [Litoribrevibacter euphylliae]|uniref:YfiR family protein n=1 Tax=Litoribrevibacter euphylliae TaxID=1834034 RepID=A0ABV7HHZ2_9GAMM